MTRTAQRQVRDLRGRQRTAALVALRELRHRGCEAGGYRLAGALLDHLCCRHLSGDYRMLVAWLAKEHAVVIAVGRHDESSQDIYATLLGDLGHEVSAEERRKPSCCDEEGLPPLNADLVAAIVDVMEQRHRRR